MATRCVWKPEDFRPAGTDFPDIVQTGAANDEDLVAALDATTSEEFVVDGVAPQGLTGALTLVVYYWMASATTGGVAVGAAVQAVTPGDALNRNTTASYDTENIGTDTVPGTAGNEDSVSITLTTADGMAAGDDFKIKVRRAVENASDTATGDLYISRVELRDAA
ncbi:MAG TPA: hypothetical protein VNK91_02020 [Burkholderiaceae bacterium]|nr:hypothetical protein [Burkholderiaceae bacterium]